MTNYPNTERSSAPRATVLTSILASTISVFSIIGCGDAQRLDDRSTDTNGARERNAMHGTDDHSQHGDAEAAGAHTPSTRLEFMSTPSTIEPGATSTWRLRIVDATSGKPVPEFDLSHEKLMHLIVVSKDLSWFNHLHPEYQGNGEFTIDAELPRVGEYKLYADYTPKGGTQEIAQHEFKTAAAGPTAAVALVADRPAKGGWMLRSAVSRPEGQPDVKGSGEYQVAMMPMPSKITAGKEVMLHFQVRDAKGTPLTDLEPYLGALGHAVLLSSDTKTYLHTHPMDAGAEGMDHGASGHDSNDSDGGHGSHGEADSHGEHDNHGDHGTGNASAATGSDVMFHTTFPSAGLYKVWGQFQHRGKIITAAFVLQVS